MILQVNGTSVYIPDAYEKQRENGWRRRRIADLEIGLRRLEMRGEFVEAEGVRRNIVEHQRALRS